MDLATHPISLALRAALLGGRYAGFHSLTQLFERIVSGIFHSERAKDILFGELVDRPAAHTPDDFGEHDVINVGVDELQTGFRERSELADIFNRLLRPLLV